MQYMQENGKFCKNVPIQNNPQVSQDDSKQENKINNAYKDKIPNQDKKPPKSSSNSGKSIRRRDQWINRSGVNKPGISALH